MSELSFEQMLDETFKTIREVNIPTTRIWI